jgi:thioredoxin-like negative regulator of GroEL
MDRVNPYLEKIAEILSDENKQVAKTFALQTAASIPAHAAGAAVGGYMGGKLEPRLAEMSSKLGVIGKKLKLGKPGSGTTLGAVIGVAVAGGLADLISLKHSLKGKIKEK